MTEETKTCPYCGEEILAIAKKCRHCGEFLDKQYSHNQTNVNSIEDADVNEKWKERFKAVDFFVIDGQWWKYNPNFWNSPLGERSKMSGKVYGDFGSCLAAFLFGGLYYLFKGMWLKCFVYLAACVIIEFILVSIVPELSSFCYIFYGGLYAVFAPYDYYRLKVLGKQW